jgi:uncharacterized membrane protein
MAGEKMTGTEESVSGLSDESKLFGALAYLLSVVTGIVVLLMKKEDAYAKFHAMQSILVFVVVFIVYVILTIAAVILSYIPIIGQILGLLVVLLQGLISLVMLILWLLLMWKAYSGVKWKLPVVGDKAEKMAASA